MLHDIFRHHIFRIFLLNCTAIDGNNLELTLIRVRTWWHPATSDYPSHCWAVFCHHIASPGSNNWYRPNYALWYWIYFNPAQYILNASHSMAKSREHIELSFRFALLIFQDSTRVLLWKEKMPNIKWANNVSRVHLLKIRSELFTSPYASTLE